MKQRIQKTLAMLLVVATLCIAAFVPTAAAESIYAYVSDSAGLNAYSDASLSNRIGTLDAYVVVEVVGLSGSTAAIYANGVGCFVRVSGLTPLQTEENERVTTEKTKVYASPTTSSASINVPKGMTLYEIRRSGDWAEIANGAYVAYIPTRYIATKAENASQSGIANEVSIPATVTGANARAYASADTSSASVSVPQGTKVTVLLMSGSWAYVERSSVRAFFRISDLTADAYLEAVPTPTPAPTAAPSLDDAIPATVTSSGAKIYVSPSRSSYSASIPQGTKVNVLKINGDWAYLEVNGVYAYCLLSNLTADAYLNQTPAPTQAPETTTVIPATVTASGAKVYASPSTSARSMSVPVGTKVNVLQISGDWAYVERSGAYAYCKVSILTPDSQLPEVTPEPTIDIDTSESIRGVVVADSVRVYSLPSTSGRYLGTMERGVEVDVFQVSGGWAYVRRDGAYGFCDVSALAPVGTTETPNDIQKLDSPVPAVVSVNKLTFYQSNSASSTYLGTLSRGDTVNVVAFSGDWAQVEKNGAYGWCLLSGLTPASDTPAQDPLDDYYREVFDATVIATNARFYASASTDSANVAIPIGTTVTVGAYNATWAYVQVNGVLGFISIGNLSRNSYTPMRSGATGSDVRQLETALLMLGYLDTNPGTKYSDYTASAVKAFQKRCGLSATGEADLATLRVLYGGAALKSEVLSSTYARGSSGDNVSRIQLRLYALGYLSKASSVDGDFGTTTYNAIRLFQSVNGISQTGEANATTLSKMYSVNASSLPSGKTPADVSSVPVVNPGDQQNNSTKISSSLASTTTSPGSTNASKLEYVIYIGQNQLGKPYVYGTSGTSSFDCTGFTTYCFKQLGIKLKRSAVDQGYDNTYPKISSVSDLRRGDLVFFDTISDSDLSDHAGIYLGAGYFIHASSGQHKVVISTLLSGYYNRVFSWGRRVLDT